MLKKSLFVIAVVAMLAMTVQAGEVKLHDWPTQYKPVPITTIPVTMDVGYWIRIKDQDKLKIHLNQVSIHEYSGCTDMKVECNFGINLSASISGNGTVGGDYSCSISPSDFDSPGGTSTVCATLKNADFASVPGGSKGVQVATVTIKVVPK